MIAQGAVFHERQARQAVETARGSVRQVAVEVAVERTPFPRPGDHLLELLELPTLDEADA